MAADRDPFGGDPPDVTSAGSVGGGGAGFGGAVGGGTGFGAPPLGPPLQRPSLPARVFLAVVGFFQRLGLRVARYFSERDPRFLTALVPALLVTTVLYVRLPTTNYIFDEQEALLANPYVNQVGFKYQDAIYRDFWGLPPNASIGSYRPIPNYMWRLPVEGGERLQKAYDAWVPADTRANMQTRFPNLPTGVEFGRSSFLQDWWNLVLHGVNGALFAAIAFRVTRRRLFGWLTGATFITAAILTEAVSGCVGIADILGGLGALLALAALGLRGHAMPFGVFLAISFGLFSKESAVVCVPLVPVAALVAAPIIHPHRPARLARAAIAFVAAAAAFVLYVELRKRWFPSPLPSELSTALPWDAPLRKQFAHDFLVWFHQAPLPKDPLNNPLANAEPAIRIAGAMRVYARGLSQVVFPWTLSGDYSSPQEPAPDRVIFPESVLGAVLTVVPLALALVFWIITLFKRRRVPLAGDIGRDTTPPRTRLASATRIGAEVALALACFFLVRFLLRIPPAPDSEAELAKHVALSVEQLRDLMIFAAVFTGAAGLLVETSWSTHPEDITRWPLMVAAVGLVWLVVSYFPHSNIPVVLPTVRAERLWYFPVIGTTMVIATVLTLVVDTRHRIRWPAIAVAVPVLFLGFQGLRAYIHATDYRDDLVFWEATKDAVPRSSKAHLNYSVMVGARGDMNTRLIHSIKARDLAPEWAMAHVYTGDTLCRTHRAEEAWPYYKSGFAIGENDRSLLALGLQCLWDEGALKTHDAELRQLATEHPGSWLAYLAVDTLDHGAEHGGVDPQYRPRSYNEGPKKKATSTDGSSDASTDPTAEITVDATSSAAVDGSADASGNGLYDPWEMGSGSARSAKPSASADAPR